MTKQELQSALMEANLAGYYAKLGPLFRNTIRLRLQEGEEPLCP